jgi:glutamate carboxypeptidase
MQRKSLSRILSLEALTGAEIKESDLEFLKRDPPVGELALLKDFAATDSATLNLAGVAVMQGKVAAILEELGFSINTLKGEARFGELIIAERAGRSGKFITLITHSDTVLGNYRDFKIELSEEKAYGSGVIDNKGGLTVGLSGLRRFLQAFPETEYSFRFICSPNEEMGSVGFTEIYRELGADTAVAFGLEPALDNGSVIHQRRGNRWYDIEIKGREAHAGRSYGEHVNAAHDAAKKIADLAKLTNYKKDVSVNVGHIEGGKNRHNIICGSAAIKLDVRFPSMIARDDLHRKIEKILAKPREISASRKFRSETAYKIVDDCPPFSLTKHSRKMAAQYAALVGRLEGRRIKSEPSGGAGDVNYLSTKHNFVLDGLGPVGGQMHTHHEFVSVPTLETRAKALAGYLHYLQKRDL